MVIAAVAIFGSHGCSCSHHKDSDNTAVDRVDSVATTTPQAILSAPVKFDADALHSYAQSVGDDSDIDATDIAQMVVHSEAAFSRLEAELENLLRNEDPADTYNVLTEFANATWVTDALTIVEFISTISPDPQLQNRVDQLTLTRNRVRTLVAQLCSTQLNRPALLNI